jgi:hypothetical protein
MHLRGPWVRRVMWRRKSNSTIAAGGWLRDSTMPFDKTKRMGAGELTALLVSQRTAEPQDIEKQAFEALVRVQKTLGKAAHACVFAYSLGLLTFFNMLSALSASGMEIDKNGLSHVSLLLIGMSNLWLATSLTKTTYITTWFGWRLRSSGPPDRAAMMLRFPEAYPYFAYFQGMRGYPKNIWPKRSDLRQIPPVIFIALALIIFAVGATALNIALAVRVWESAYPSPWASRLTVAGSVVLSLLAVSIPRFDDFKARYGNYALSNLLTGMTPEKREAAHRRIALVRLRRDQAKS